MSGVPEFLGRLLLRGLVGFCAAMVVAFLLEVADVITWIDTSNLLESRHARKLVLAWSAGFAVLVMFIGGVRITRFWKYQLLAFAAIGCAPLLPVGRFFPLPLFLAYLRWGRMPAGLMVPLLLVHCAVSLAVARHFLRRRIEREQRTADEPSMHAEPS